MSIAPQSATSAVQERVAVEEMEPATSFQATTDVVPFACRLPADISLIPFDPDEPLAASKQSVPINVSPDMTDQGIVGTITLLGNSSAMIWYGWGRIVTSHAKGNSDTTTSELQRIDLGKASVGLGKSEPSVSV
jgi:hypothetical protein